MGACRFVGIVAVVATIAGCSTSSTSPRATPSDAPPTTHKTTATTLRLPAGSWTAGSKATTVRSAQALCESALEDAVVSADPATVEEFRRTTIGTRAPTQDTLYPSLAADSFAAWCWTGKGPYRVYEVTVDGKAHLVVQNYDVASIEAHGAPRTI